MNRKEKHLESSKLISLNGIKHLVAVFVTVLILVISQNTVVYGNQVPTVSNEELVDTLRGINTEIRGEKLEVDLLLRAIGRQAGVNIIVDESIDETVSLDLGNMSLYDVFQLIMKTKDLSYYEANNAILIERSEDYRQGLKDMVMVRMCSKYGDVSNHLDELQVVKSEDGSLTLSRDGNCVVVRDHEQNVERIQQMLLEVDEPQPQVHIKARIVAMQKKISRQLGIKWGFEDLTNVDENTFTADVDLSVVDPTTSLSFGFIRDSFLLDIDLTAMQEREELYLLSSPRIVVLDGEEAEIKQGKEIPYESGTAENRDTSFREAVLSLNVVPKILHDKFLRLNLKVTNDSVDLDNTTEDDQPLINRQEVKTNLFLEDGVTVVVGGILTKGNDYANQEVPFLADIPLIGELFKSRDEYDENYELLIFITPTIIGDRHGFMSRKSIREKKDKAIETTVMSVPEPVKGEQKEQEKRPEKEPKQTEIPDTSEAGGLIISPIQVKERLVKEL